MITDLILVFMIVMFMIFLYLKDIKITINHNYKQETPTHTSTSLTEDDMKEIEKEQKSYMNAYQSAMEDILGGGDSE